MNQEVKILENDLLKIGAAYIRVSDERQDEYSPDSQLKKIREYAKKEGCIIPDEYVFYDDGISGKSVKKRADFNRMIAMAKEKDHPFETIFVWKFSRFARNQEEAIVYKNLLRKEGVSVKSVSEPIPDDAFGTLIERIIEWMDAFYLTNLSTEVSRGMEEKISRGEPVSPAPFGYKNAKNTYVIDEEAAEIVKEIFERYASGEKQREIAVSLGQRGVRTKKGNLPENRWVDYILWNPVYVGKQRWTLDGSKKVSTRHHQNEGINISDGNWKPIISMELWEKVQGMLQAQKKAYPKYAKRQQPIDYMLKGIVRCDCCGATLAMSSAVSGKAKTPTMQCCNYSKGTCTVSHSITVPKIEAAFLEGMELAVKTKQFKVTPTPKKKKDTPSVDYDKLIAVEERKLNRAKEAFLAEIDTIEQYKENKTEITQRIEELKAKRDKETFNEIDFNAFAKKVRKILDFCKNENVTAAAKNELLHSIIEKAVYEKANQHLAIYFHEI